MKRHSSDLAFGTAQTGSSDATDMKGDCENVYLQIAHTKGGLVSENPRLVSAKTWSFGPPTMRKKMCRF